MADFMSLLYPRESATRRVVDLGGLWRFQFDPKGIGRAENWMAGLPSPHMIPVPSSFSDLFTDRFSRDYTGDFWYETEFFLPETWAGQAVQLRFGAAAHRAVVFVNGKELGSHEGGFLPFCVSLGEESRFGGSNRLSVQMNNELREDCLPVGRTDKLPSSENIARGYFDFFNYAGLLRPVKLLALPQERIVDFTVRHTLKGKDALVDYEVVSNGHSLVRVDVYDEAGQHVAAGKGKSGCLTIAGVRLWKARDAYLYRFVLTIIAEGQTIDSYHEDIGIRTIQVEDGQLLLNGESVYLKGFGRHEESELAGRALSLPALKRDFELMKWVGANSFRAAHYPHSEETYLLADREGFLIIDETPAVGLMTSTLNFMDAARGKQTGFFQKDTTQALLDTHLKAVEDLIQRDKNRACVIAWCLLNEPESTDDAALPYLEQVFALAREKDPQKRPCTFTSLMTARPGVCKCHQLCDIICLNRYYGWYVFGGQELSTAMMALDREIKQWAQLAPEKPIIFTEYGADTHPAESKLPDVMWSQEYQAEYLKMCHNVFDAHPQVKGEQLWSFADFQTTEGILRVNGNRKGLFTRQRQPKLAAHSMKMRWENLPADYKAHVNKTKEDTP